MTDLAEYLASLQQDRDDEAWFQLAFVFEARAIQHRQLCREWRASQPKRPRTTVEVKRKQARARKQRWLAANRDKERQYKAAWRADNSERIKQSNQNYAAKKAAQGRAE
jgi:hypothetical protein